MHKSIPNMIFKHMGWLRLRRLRLRRRKPRESLATDFTISVVDVIFKQRNGKLTATTLCLVSLCMNYAIHFSGQIHITWRYVNNDVFRILIFFQINFNNSNWNDFEDMSITMYSEFWFFMFLEWTNLNNSLNILTNWNDFVPSNCISFFQILEWLIKYSHRRSVKRQQEFSDLTKIRRLF